MHTITHKLKQIALPVIAFIVIVSLWELVDALFKIKEVIIPNPHEIVHAFVENFSSILYNTGITMSEALIGFTIGALAGMSIAMLFEASPILKKSLLPYAIAFKATPAYVLAPLFVLWFGNNLMPKIAIAAIITTFPILVGAVKGLSSTTQDQLDLFTSLKATKWQTFYQLKIPNALPYVFPALKIGTTMSVIGATIAEFTGSQSGIGHLIITSSYYIDTSLMFAAIISISLLGVIFFYSIQAVEKKVVFWQN